MSFEPDNLESELDIKDLLREILVELRIIKLHQQEITDQIIKAEDTAE